MDEARHALDELAILEGYVTTSKRQKRVGNRKDGEGKAVDFNAYATAADLILVQSQVQRLFVRAWAPAAPLAAPSRPLSHDSDVKNKQTSG